MLSIYENNMDRFQTVLTGGGAASLGPPILEGDPCLMFVNSDKHFDTSVDVEKTFDLRTELVHVLTELSPGSSRDFHMVLSASAWN